ncbi:MAG TPA: cation:proton antiporter [Nitrosopumilaceae archaeon]|nr:cation:proton antiporter [Nitrosopumilaceae archaeon]
MAFEAILFLAILVIAAKLCGEAFHRIKQPTIIGNVLAGIIVGPAFFALVEPIEEIELFISIGVFFLFFLIGLEEIDLPGLFKVLRGRIFAGSAIGFLVPFFVAGFFGLWLDMDFVMAFAIASVIGASSLGVTAKVLTDLGKLKSTIGLEIFTITGIIEFIAIVITSVLIQIDSTQTPEFSEFLWLFVKMIIFFAIAGLVSVFVLPHFFRFIKKHLEAQQVYFAIVIGVILLVAYFAELSGIHGAIGALLLGIAVSRMNRQEYMEISKSVNTVGYGIFIPIFFAGIGLHFTPDFIELPYWIIAGFIGIIVGVKFFGSYLAVKIAKMRPATTVAYGVMSKGAVDLALMLSLLKVQLLENELFSLLVFGTLITMTISSVELQRKLKKIVPVKVGMAELSLMPVYFRRIVSDYTAEKVMKTEFLKIQSDTNLSEFLEQNDISKNVFLVFNKDNQLVGLLSKREIDKVHKKYSSSLLVRHVMHKKFFTTTPQDYLFSVIQKMNMHPFDMIPVVDGRKVVGVVTSKVIVELVAKEEKTET